MLKLTPIEARVLGALIEKEITTPDQYPLSLNAVTVACNQKSNREPVLNLSQEEVQSCIDELVKRNLVSEVIFGSRVTKYKHRFCNSEFSPLQLNPRQLGILCVMFLRGPQTPGELRTRTQRLCNFADVEEVENCLEHLMSEEKGTLVIKLAREPGKRESRFMHLFYDEESMAGCNTVTDANLDLATGEPVVAATGTTGFGVNSAGAEGGVGANIEASYQARISDLENELTSLREEFNALRAQWEDFNNS
ncbi:MAG: YceH family protein [Agarilytica sp.]